MGRSSSADAPLPVALSCGEPSGIGPELVVKAWLAVREGRLRPFVVFADPAILAARARLLGLDLSIEEIDNAASTALSGSALAVCPLENRHVDRPGTPIAGNAAGVIEAIERAVGAVASGHAAALVTPPIAKKPLYEAGFAFPGHTEFLGHLSGKLFGRPARPVMMLAGAGLRTVPLTIHVALAEVPPLVTTELIVETAMIVAGDLVRRFAVPRPRLAVSGLNPHAGEDGAMGREEIDIIAPAVARLRAGGLDVKGPLPADTMFHARARREYDAAICMYHDQALIPLKTLAFDEGVNVTLGLPFIRTSPDHGTAFDIAGKGIARPDSLIAAIAMAQEMAAAEAGRP